MTAKLVIIRTKGTIVISTRRTFLGMASSLLIPLATDSQIEEVRTGYQDYLYRAPYKFGGKEVDRVTLLNVHCRVRTKTGKSAVGFGSMPLGNVWSFPAPNIPYETTLAAMKSLSQKIAQLLRDFREYAHPLDVDRALQPEYLKAALEISREMKLPQPIPKLCSLVTASPFDAALHDAFGRLHNRSSYAACGKEFVRYDLAHYLTADFRGEYLDRYVMREPAARIRMFHSVGASDPLTMEDVKHRIADGLPETLEDWIPYNGLTAFKIKLNGDNLAWDVERVAAIERVAARAEAKRHFSEWIYSLDFNERCPNVQYVLDFEHQLQGKAPSAFQRVQYIEQPTARDLAANRQNTMFKAARLAPIVIDESLTGLDALLLAREMGYTGVALKACKGISETLLLTAASRKYGMFRCVQDLTCPGAAFVESAGIAAHVPGISGLEANAREYVPAANRGWEKRFPGLFVVKDGYLDTSALTGVGLCTS